MNYLVWSMLFLMGCAQSQVISSRPDADFNSKLGTPSLSESDSSIGLFAWSLRSVGAQTFDTLEPMDTDSRYSLFSLLNLASESTNAQVSVALKLYAAQMMDAASERSRVLVQQGQLKHHDIDSLAGESQVIRSISKAQAPTSDNCYEMRKVFTESKPVARWLSPEAAASWRRVGLAQTAPSVSPSSPATTKAFLLIDFVDRLSRLYIYEESKDGGQSELTELVVSCAIAAQTLNHDE